MTGEDQMRLALKIGMALTAAGIKVQRAAVVGGNLKSWNDIPAEALIGRWLQNGWRVVEVDATAESEVPEVAQYERRLKLV